MGYGIFALTLCVVPLLFLHEGFTNGFNMKLFQTSGWTPEHDEEILGSSEGTDYNPRVENGIANLSFRYDDESSKIANNK